MSSRIDPNLSGVASKAGQKVSGSGNGTAVGSGRETDASKPGAKAVAGDTVVLTERSQLIESLEKRIASQPAIDSARVEAVRADIQSGNYEVDADNIAELLLRLEGDLDR